MGTHTLLRKDTRIFRWGHTHAWNRHKFIFVIVEHPIGSWSLGVSRILFRNIRNFRNLHILRLLLVLLRAGSFHPVRLVVTGSVQILEPNSVGLDDLPALDVVFEAKLIIGFVVGLFVEVSANNMRTHTILHEDTRRSA